MTQDPFNEEWEKLVRAEYGDFPKKDVERLIYQAKRTRLDPLIRQLYATKRKAKQPNGSWKENVTIEATIDGLRLVAERSGKYRGQTQPQWCGEDGVWVDIWVAKKPPVAARVGIHREGFVEPVYSPAKYESFAQTKEGEPVRQWKTMGDHMLSKCSEALALRKAFPHELSGIYTKEEMGQAGDDAADEKPRHARPGSAAAERPPVDDKAVLDKLAAARGTKASYLAAIKEATDDLSRIPAKLRGVTWKMVLSFAADAEVTEKEVRAAMDEAKQDAPKGSDDPAAREAAARHDRDLVFKFGPEKDVPLRDIEDDHLTVYAEILGKSIENPEKKKFKALNQKQLATVEAEIEFRQRGDASDAASLPSRDQSDGDPGPIDDADPPPPSRDDDGDPGPTDEEGLT